MRLAARLCLSLSLCLTLTGCQTLYTLVPVPAKPPGSPVAVVGGPYTGTAGTAVSFSASKSSDPQNLPLTYEWDFGDGAYGTSATPTHAYTSAGTYTLSVTVTDTDNLSATASTRATIAAAPPPPLLPPIAVTGGPYTGGAGLPLTFNGGASTDPQGLALTYAWNFGDGSTGTGPMPTHTYAALGTYTVTLAVTDTASLSGVATTSANIGPGAPTAITGGQYLGTAGFSGFFNGTASTDPQGYTLTYAWSFGDGTTATGPTPSHTYSSAGIYTISLTVTDTISLSGSATTTDTIVVAPPATAATRLYQTTATQTSATTWTSTVEAYPVGVSGTVTPVLTLTSPNTTDIYQSIGVDAYGNLYVGVDNAQTNGLVEVLVLALPTASGVVTPIRTIVGPNTQMVSALSPAVDNIGNLYVVSGLSGIASNVNVLEFAAGADGNVAPIRTITLLDQPVIPEINDYYPIAVDPGGNLVIGLAFGNGSTIPPIEIFTPGQSGAATPARTITIGPQISGLTVGRDGNIYVSAAEEQVPNSSETILELAGGTDPNTSVVPLNAIDVSYINGPSGLLPGETGYGLAVDFAGNIYQNELYGPGTQSFVLTFAAGSTGVATPLIQVINPAGLDLAVH